MTIAETSSSTGVVVAFGEIGCSSANVYSGVPEFTVLVVKIPTCVRVPQDPDGFGHVIFAPFTFRVSPLTVVAAGKFVVLFVIATRA